MLFLLYLQYTNTIKQWHKPYIKYLFMRCFINMRMRFPFVPKTSNSSIKVCQQLQCPCLIANGVADHEHFLFVLSPKRAVAEVMKEVKRMSSLYLKYHDQAYYKHFCWQAGYGAFGVSVKLKEVVYDYISHQQEHHKRMDMRAELTALLQSAQVKNYDEALYWEKD